MKTDYPVNSQPLHKVFLFIQNVANKNTNTKTYQWYGGGSMVVHGGLVVVRGWLSCGTRVAQ